MRHRARAASLVAALAAVLAAVPATAAAQAPHAVIDNTVWPSTSTNTPPPNVPGLLSSVECEAGAGERTFSYAMAGQGMLLGADGTFSEQGTFTIGEVDGTLRVTDLDATFSGSSSRASVTGERHLLPEQVGNTEAYCTRNRYGYPELRIVLYRLHSDADVVYAGGAAASDHGWVFMHMGGGHQPSRFGFYTTQFSSDQDRDEHRVGEDNCRTTPNPDQADADRDGAGDACDWDVDGDLRSNERDNCAYVPNPGQEDADGDGLGDACDPKHDVHDSDGDGVVDDVDNCVDVPNEHQEDGGGGPLGDACEDRDGDGAFDLVDNCVADANGDQADLDGDRSGDACDPDDDGDGAADGADSCPTVVNPLQRDSDSDGRGDECDDAFDSTDGFAGGGGRLAGDVHLSVALHSRGGALHGSGHLVDGPAVVRLLGLSGLWRGDGRVVAVGDARVGDGAPQRYRLELTDGPDTFELEVGGRRWAGPLTHGNLVVK